MGPRLKAEKWIVAVCCEDVTDDGDDARVVQEVGDDARVVQEVGDEAQRWGGKLLFVDRCED